MSGLKRIIYSVSILLLSGQNTVLANEYPAPPGHYGQDEILKNSTFNTGKGSPYISILPAGESNTDSKQQTLQTKSLDTNTTQLPEPAIRQTVAPAQTINYVKPPSVPRQQLPVAPEPKPIAVPVAQQPVYSPAPETAPSRFQEQIYPDAEDLSRHYEDSRKLQFGQWGEELPETQEQPRYDYPPLQQINTSRYQAAPVNPSFQGSPDLANKMFNRQANRRQSFNRTSKNSNGFFNPGNFPVDMMDQFWGGNRGTGFMPPINNQLKTFDQFPVPQNIYGPSLPGSSAGSGNRQYFRQIPKEEIIYPPHYPGTR